MRPPIFLLGDAYVSPGTHMDAYASPTRLINASELWSLRISRDPSPTMQWVLCFESSEIGQKGKNKTLLCDWPN